MQPPNQVKININIDELPTFECPKCQGIQFAPVFTIKAISALVSPNGQSGSLNHQTGFMCTGCGYAASTKDIAMACKEQVEKSEKLLIIPGGKE
jgi:hypothetical protein